MGVKILFFSRGTLGQNSMFPEKGVKILYFFPVPWKRGIKTAEPTNQLHWRGAPPPPPPPPPGPAISAIGQHGFIIVTMELASPNNAVHPSQQCIQSSGRLWEHLSQASWGRIPIKTQSMLLTFWNLSAKIPWNNWSALKLTEGKSSCCTKLKWLL